MVKKKIEHNPTWIESSDDYVIFEYNKLINLATWSNQIAREITKFDKEIYYSQVEFDRRTSKTYVLLIIKPNYRHRKSNIRGLIDIFEPRLEHLAVEQGKAFIF